MIVSNNRESNWELPANTFIPASPSSERFSCLNDLCDQLTYLCGRIAHYAITLLRKLKEAISQCNATTISPTILYGTAGSRRLVQLEEGLKLFKPTRAEPRMLIGPDQIAYVIWSHQHTIYMQPEAEWRARAHTNQLRLERNPTRSLRAPSPFLYFRNNQSVHEITPQEDLLLALFSEDLRAREETIKAQTEALYQEKRRAALIERSPSPLPQLDTFFNIIRPSQRYAYGNFIRTELPQNSTEAWSYLMRDIAFFAPTAERALIGSRPTSVLSFVIRAVASVFGINRLFSRSEARYALWWDGQNGVICIQAESNWRAASSEGLLRLTEQGASLSGEQFPSEEHSAILLFIASLLSEKRLTIEDDTDAFFAARLTESLIPRE